MSHMEIFIRIALLLLLMAPVVYLGCVGLSYWLNDKEDD